ncbi:MAG: class I SAM-dependent methyltransferase [Deltaproteobacteria bacterium]
MRIWPLLSEVLHSADRPAPSAWQACYETKFAVMQLLQPRSIVEFGVRTGYSAFAFLTACPKTRFVGLDANVDAHGGFVGAIDHARRILAPFDASIAEMTTAQYAKLLDGDAVLPSYDLIHVDADHTFAGCTFDLDLSLMLSPRHIVVDDYLGIPDVAAACDAFFARNGDGWTRIVVSDGHHGLVIFSRVIPKAGNLPFASSQPSSLPGSK